MVTYLRDGIAPPTAVTSVNGQTGDVVLDLSAGSSPVGSNEWLISNALAQAFVITGSVVYDASFGTLTGAAIEWPDGTPGTYSVSSLDDNGAVTVVVITFIATTTKTVTVTIPRNASSQVVPPMTAVVS